MSETEPLGTPEDRVPLMVDFRAGLGFGVESAPVAGRTNDAKLFRVKTQRKG
jgi:hypothetical protein